MVKDHCQIGGEMDTGESSIVAACAAPGGAVEVACNQVLVLVQHNRL